MQDRKKNEITFASQLKAALEILTVFSNLTKLYFLPACIFWLLLRVKINQWWYCGFKGAMPRGYCYFRSVLWLSHYFVPLSSAQTGSPACRVTKKIPNKFPSRRANHNNWKKINSNNNWPKFFKFQSMSMFTIVSNRRTTGNSFNAYRKSYIKPAPLSNEPPPPPPFRGGKLISPPPPPLSPPSLFFTSN